MASLFDCWFRVVVWHLTLRSIEPFDPVITEKLTRVGCANRSVAAREIRCRTELVAPPADAIGTSWMKRQIGHAQASSFDSSSAAFGKRMLFSRCTCSCRSRSNASSSCRHTR